MDSLAKLYPDLGKSSEGKAGSSEDKRLIVMSHLKKTNNDMLAKMGTLIDLTNKVIKKIKL